jgi:hypothetical protein
VTCTLKRAAWRSRFGVVVALAVLVPAGIAAVVPVGQPLPLVSLTTINDGPGDQTEPHVSGDWAVYTSGITIRYYDFLTGIDAEIPGDSARDSLSDVSGGKIVFSREVAGVKSTVIFWRPVAGGAEGHLELPGIERNPSIAGNFIVFERQEALLDDSNLFVYGVVDNRLFQITDAPGVNEQLNDVTGLPDGRLRVVWASDEDGFAAHNIKAATFSLPSQALTTFVQPPVAANGSSVFSARRGVVPVKFTLAVDGIATCELPPVTIALSRIAGGTLGTINETDFIQPSDTGAEFRVDAAACQYAYNLGSSSLGPGTYLVSISVAGVAAGNATFSLK